MRVTDSHIYFYGSVFSQWHKCLIRENEMEFNSAEQYMMFHKAMLFGDLETADKIMQATEPKVQKALGKTVSNFDEKVWNLQKFDIVVEGNLLKFTQNERLKRELQNTLHKVLVEASPYDSVWGVGLAVTDNDVLHETKWKGLNLLGKALMVVREKIKAL